MRKSISLAALAVALSACSQIDTGNVGVESTFGQVKEASLPPGVYFTMFKTVQEVSAKEQAIDLADMQPKARDNVTLQDVDISIYVRINAAKAPAIMVKYAGDMALSKEADGYLLGQNLIRRIGRESVYRAFSQYPASEMHMRRTELAAAIRDSMQAELDRYGDWD